MRLTCRLGPRARQAPGPTPRASRPPRLYPAVQPGERFQRPEQEKQHDPADQRLGPGRQPVTGFGAMDVTSLKTFKFKLNAILPQVFLKSNTVLKFKLELRNFGRRSGSSKGKVYF